MISWKSSGDYARDDDAFIFPIDNKTIYIPQSKSVSIYYCQWGGPSFGGYTLSLDYNPLNAENHGFCYTNNLSYGDYNVELDSDDNNEITGEG